MEKTTTVTFTREEIIELAEKKVYPMKLNRDKVKFTTRGLVCEIEGQNANTN
jgi:hypothetical protein